MDLDSRDVRELLKAWFLRFRILCASQCSAFDSHVVLYPFLDHVRDPVPVLFEVFLDDMGGPVFFLHDLHIFDLNLG